MKFEHIFAIVVTVILAAALYGAMFVLKDDNMTSTILTAFVGALSAVTAFFFTKHKPGD